MSRRRSGSCGLFARGRRSFRLEMSGVHLGRTMVGYNEFGADAVIDPGGVRKAVILAMGVGSPPS